MKTILFCLAMLTLGCQTTFTGDPHIDPGQCQTKCQADRMQMAGMVYMGEYSSACLCEVPKPPQGAPGSAVSTLLLGDAGAGGATAGVIMQMRRAQQRQNQGYYR